MTAVLDVDTARAEYAKWFVQRHYLKKRHFVDHKWLFRWSKAQERGYIRYYKKPLGDSVFLYDEFERSYDFSFTGIKEPEKQWWRVDLQDIDNPINDDNTMVCAYRNYRQHAANVEILNWLLAEAEYHVVTNEAWLRAYGVDVVTE